MKSVFDLFLGFKKTLSLPFMFCEQRWSPLKPAFEKNFIRRHLSLLDRLIQLVERASNVAEIIR